MLLPVAARDTDPRGFHWTQEGELVYPELACPNADDGCACQYAFVGLETGESTTLARVADIDIDFDGLRLAVRSALTRDGHLDEYCADTSNPLVVDIVAELVGIGTAFDEGTPLIRGLTEITAASADRAQ